MSLNLKSTGWKNIFRGVMFVCLSALLMGNESCDEEDPLIKLRDGRVLKKRASIGQVRSRSINVGGSGRFDFSFAAGLQLYHLINESERYVLPGLDRATAHGAMVSSQDYDVYSDWAKNNQKVHLAATSREAECLLYLPQVKISGEIHSFEVVSGGGVEFGFTPAKTSGILPDFNVDVESFSLSLSLEGSDNLSNTLLSTGLASATQTKTDMGVSINFGLFSFGSKYYFESPLSKVTYRALIRAMNELNVKLDKEPWTSRVIENHDTHLVVYGGRRSGIQEGDRFEIYNEIHYWKDAPCQSAYRGAIPTTQGPLAIIEITQLGDDISRGVIIEKNYSESPILGAKVKWIPEQEDD